eukprot:COSAG05_NODE_7477_length_806_cov_0.765205_1_plen_50_part_10
MDGQQAKRLLEPVFRPKALPSALSDAVAALKPHDQLANNHRDGKMLRGMS